MADHAAIHVGIVLAVSGCIHCSDVAAQSSPAIDVYGSLRVQAESVHFERSGSYTSVRDAYSRAGVKIDYPLESGRSLVGQLEIPVDAANFRLRDPYDQDEALRIASIGLRGNFGTITYGQQWMPYYNAVAAPVDRFSSYYSGFATYTVFRVPRTVAFQTPDLNGFSMAAAYAGSAGNRRSTSRIDDRRWQAAATYERGETRVAVGVDDRGNGGAGHSRLYGLSASHQFDKLYLALKYEVFDSENHQPGAFSGDGNRAINLVGSYVSGPATLKLMVAKVKNYGGNIVHLGVEYQLSEKQRLFAEMYRETGNAALTTRRGGLGDADANAAGGRAVVLGLRHDF